MNIEVDYSDMELFNPVFNNILFSEKRYNVLKGGAGSGKSIQMIDMILMRLLSRKNYKAMVARKFSVTLKKTVWADFQNMIDKRNLIQLFKINKSDYTITCINGNVLYFTGLDTPEKIKSLEMTVVDIWLEEATDFFQEDFEQLDLRLRGINKYKYQIFLTFNPISSEHWLKNYFFDKVNAIVANNLITNSSTYLDNKFIDDEYKSVMDAKKETNPKYYNVYCLGDWGTTGKTIYTNWEVKDFETQWKNKTPDKKSFNIENYFKVIYYGLDFGFNDPMCMIKIGWKDQELYIMGEIYRTGIITQDLCQLAVNEFPTVKQKFVFADCAEPDRIAEMRRLGFNSYPCHKGANYKKGAIDWINSHKMYIDPRCREFITEIQNYCYKKYRDREQYYDDPQDFGDHLMDALIYATDHLRNANKGTC